MPKPTPSTLESILARLRAAIWGKPKPPPKPRASWQGLKVGDKLNALNATGNPYSVEYTVVAVTSEGVTIQVTAPYVGAQHLNITTPDELARFTKVRKPRRRKDTP